MGDWRLPSPNELQSLIDLAQSSPASPTGHHFDGVPSRAYWSSSTICIPPVPPSAYFVNLDDGSGSVAPKVVALHVWPVRGGQ